MTGLKVNQLELVAFKTSQDLDGKVISVKQPGKADSLKIDYNEPVNLGTTAEPLMTTIKDIVSEYVPSQLEEKKLDEKSFGFDALGKIGNQGLAIMEAELLKSGKHIITNISRATPTQRTKIDKDVEELKKKYPNKTITVDKLNNDLVIAIKNFIPETTEDALTGKGKTEEQESLRKKQVEAFNNFPIKEKFNIIRDQLYSDVPLNGVLTNDNPTKDSLWKCRVKLPDGRFLLVSKPDNLKKVLNQEVVFENTMFESYNNQTGESILIPAISVKLAVNGQHVAWVRTSEYKPPVDKQESIPDLSAETINKDINIESLKSAKQKGFDIEYQSPTDSTKNGRYTITEITKNSVSLTNVQGEKVVVKKEDIASSIKEVIDPKGVKGKKETIDTMANNQKTVATLSISLTPGISKSDALKNILNSKC
jgi:hypothetical protein